MQHFNLIRSIVLSLVILVCLASPCFCSTQANVCPLDQEDEAYLRALAADTWACIGYFVEPDTGLPYDTSKRGPITSVTNLGYYAASCGVAARMGYIPHDEAVERVRKVLESYKRFEKWNGFSQSWNEVKTLKPAGEDRMISLLDSANMVAGFVVAGELLPELRKEVDEIITAMNFKPFYDKKDGRLFGGYNMELKKIDPGWHIGDSAGDGRMAAFWAIAVGAAPPESWDRLSRGTESHYGYTILRPAWLGGGLFMQVQDGLFLDETNIPEGRSASDFAYTQMLYAKNLGLPVWGWSACFAPDGRYLGWGGLEVPVVTPHAVGMAAMYYPRKAVECFRELEKRGARAPFEDDGKKHAFGFRDSIDLRDGKVSDLYIPDLDQAMLFFALVNVLEDGLVQKAFQRHPTVRRGIALIPEYKKQSDGSRLKELCRRDREPLPEIKTAGASKGKIVQIDNFSTTSLDKNKTGGRNSTWTRDKNDRTVSVSMKRSRDSDDRRHFMAVKYDVESKNPAFGGITFDLNHVDATGCTMLSMQLRGTPDKLKVELHCSGGSGATMITGIRKDQWTEFNIPLQDFGGMITDWNDMYRLVLVFEDRVSKPRSGTLDIDDIRLHPQPIH